MEVSKTFSRTVQVKQYEPFTATISFTVPSCDIGTVSDGAIKDIDSDIAAYLEAHRDGGGVGKRRLAEIELDMVMGKPMTVEDFESLSAEENASIQELKKAIKRSPDYKNREGNSKVDNEQNRSK